MDFASKTVTFSSKICELNHENIGFIQKTDVNLSITMLDYPAIKKPWHLTIQQTDSSDEKWGYDRMSQDMQPK